MASGAEFEVLLQSKTAAPQNAFEHDIRQELLGAGGEVATERPRVPAFKDFAQTFLATYARTNNKPSEIESKESTLRVHLVPGIGHLALTSIKPPDIEIYRSKKLGEGLSRKSINNHLTVLRRALVIAVEWGLIENVLVVRWLEVPPPEFDFLTTSRLIDSSKGLIQSGAA